jgi:hypothetical protein
VDSDAGQQRTYGVREGAPVVIGQVIDGFGRQVLSGRPGDASAPFHVREIDPRAAVVNRARHRQRQASYEACQRAGIALYPAPLGAIELGAWSTWGCLKAPRLTAGVVSPMVPQQPLCW